MILIVLFTNRMMMLTLTVLCIMLVGVVGTHHNYLNYNRIDDNEVTVNRRLAFKFSSNSTRIAYVCISGELSKLELHNKIQRLFIPLNSYGFSLYIGLALYDGFNNFRQLALKKSIPDVIQELRKVEGVKEVKHINPKYSSEMRINGTNRFHEAYAERQLRSLAYCNSWPKLTEEADVLVRVKDNALIQTLELNFVLDYVRGDVILSSKCDQWRQGINEKLLFAHGSRAHDFFSSPYENYLSSYDSSKTKDVVDMEHFLKVTYLKKGFKMSKLLEMSVTTFQVHLRGDDNGKELQSCSIVGMPFRPKLTKHCPVRSMNVLSYESLCWSGSVLKEKSKKVIESGNSASEQEKFAYICITGELSRLELQNKIEKLFKPLHLLGYSLYVGLALSVADYPTSGRSSRYVLETSVQQVISELINVNGVRKVEHYPPHFDDLKLHSGYNYLRNSSLKGNMQGRLAMRNAFIFKSLQCCGYWDEVDVVTDFIVRMRGDSFILSLDLKRMLPLVENGALVTSNCNSKFGGINDGVMFAPSSRGADFFNLPLEEFMTLDNLAVNTQFLNPERLFMNAYSKHGFKLQSSNAIVATTVITKPDIELGNFYNCTAGPTPLLPRVVNSFCPKTHSNRLKYGVVCWHSNIVPLKVPSVDLDTSYSTERKSAYLCITGQLSRLEIHHKIRFLLNPLYSMGYSLYVGLALTEGRANYSNDNSGARLSLLKSINDVVTILQNVNGVKGVSKFTPSFEGLKSNPNYDKWLGNFTRRDRKGALIHGNRIKNQVELASNNARQFKTLQHCNEWPNLENEMDLLVRLREDVLFSRLDLPHVLRMVSNGAVVTSRCDQWHGINDKIAFAPGSLASDFFNAPYHEYIDFDRTLYNGLWLNAEQLYKLAYKKRGFDLQSTNALVVTKTVTRIKSTGGMTDNVSGELLSGNCTVVANPFRHRSTRHCPMLNLDKLSYDAFCW